MIIYSRENTNCFNVQLGSAVNNIWKSLLMQTLTTYINNRYNVTILQKMGGARYMQLV